MNKAISALMVLMLGACASASHTYGPDGREAYSLNCSGMARTWGACYERAGDLCGTAGYDVLERNGDASSIVTGAAGGQSAAFSGGTTWSRSLVIACRRPQ